VPLGFSACLLGPVHTSSAVPLWIPYLESHESNNNVNLRTELSLLSHSKLLSSIQQSVWYLSLRPSSETSASASSASASEGDENSDNYIFFTMKIKFKSFLQLQQLYSFCDIVSGEEEVITLSQQLSLCLWRERCVGLLKQNGLEFMKLKLYELQSNFVVTLEVVTQEVMMSNEETNFSEKDLEGILRELISISLNSFLQHTKLLEATVRDCSNLNELLISDGALSSFASSSSSGNLTLDTLLIGLSCHFSVDSITLPPSSSCSSVLSSSVVSAPSTSSSVLKQLISAHEWCLVSPRHTENWKEIMRRDLWNVLQTLPFPSESFFIPKLFLSLLHLTEMSFSLELSSSQPQQQQPQQQQPQQQQPQQQQQQSLVVTMCAPEIGITISQLVQDLSIEEKEQFILSLTTLLRSSPLTMTRESASSSASSLELWLNQILSYAAMVSYLTHLSHSLSAST
jgi:hypothetical protein